jgi:hypothetical protein
MDPDVGGTRAETSSPRRSPVTVFHVVVFVLGGGLAVFWSRWGLFVLGVVAVVGLVLARAKASSLDMKQERRRTDPQPDASP